MKVSKPSGMSRPAHHRPDGRFANPPGSPVRQIRLSEFAAYVAQQVAQGRRRPPVPADHALSEAEALAQWEALDGGDGVLWLGHATFLIRIAGTTILTDPYLGLVAGPRNIGPRRYVPAAIHPRRLPRIDVIAASHDHYDHICEWTLRELADRRHQVEVICPLRVGRLFRNHGFTRVHELDWGDRRHVGDVRITALPAIHFSGRGALDRNRTLWVSYGFQGPPSGDRPGAHVWFSGDTGHGPVFRHIGAAEGPFDLAIVGIGAYAPRSIMRPVHADPEEGLEIGADVNAHVTLGMHWGSIMLTTEPVLEPAERFRRAAEARGLGPDRAWLMKVGEARPLPRRWPSN
jgi:L-ascorbate metabolism protein UlaG (beta-lactamase superfamily)